MELLLCDTETPLPVGAMILSRVAGAVGHPLNHAAGWLRHPCHLAEGEAPAPGGLRWWLSAAY